MSFIRFHGLLLKFLQLEIAHKELSNRETTISKLNGDLNALRALINEKESLITKMRSSSTTIINVKAR